MVEVTAFDHLVLNVRDVEVSASWYVAALGMRRRQVQVAPGRERTILEFGRNKINLRPAHATQEEWVTGATVAPGSADLCFLTQASPETVIENFDAVGLKVELGPVTKLGALGPICSVYVRDPDGNLVEVASYQEQEEARGQPADAGRGFDGGGKDTGAGAAGALTPKRTRHPGPDPGSSSSASAYEP